MIKKLLLLFFVFIYFSCAVFAQGLQSPREFLGYEPGQQFTPHYRIVEYFKYIAEASKNVKLQQYGATNEGRPLLAMFIASDDNIGRLDAIRHNNLRLAGIESGSGSLNMPVVTWLSYNVHGNEPASSEAAMLTLFDLVNPANTAAKTWLKNTVVVIDPCLNPDGRERYTNFYNSVAGAMPNDNPDSREHNEPWPGGRTNHYYADLNRDWAWQQQKETQARVALFNQWLPQVHVDYHEQGYNSPYYFAPAAEPYHKDITPWQRQFQVTIGKNNARYFDTQGWMYFTRQEFDLLYPSYGDTYPLYNGSIGMTYEQGGIGGGLAVTTASGDTLTFADRIAHHHATGLSTIETVSENAQKVLSEYKKFFDNSRTNPPGEYKTYIIKNDNNNNINKLAAMLRSNGIQYGFGLANKAVSGYDYFTGKTEQYKVNSNDLVINAYQPKAVLVHVLLEPKTFIPDSNTYDITAWSLPFAFGLRAYGLKESFKPLIIDKEIIAPKPLTNNHAYAYVSAWQSVNDVKFLTALLKNNIRVRYAQAPFEAGGKRFAAGSLLITRSGNNRADFDRVVTKTAAGLSQQITPLSSGFVDKGADIGSDEVKLIDKPNIGLISGEGVDDEAMGEVWHFFDAQLYYPITLINYQNLDHTRLSDFDVLIFADGDYDGFPSDKLQTWIKDGGKLIALDKAVSQLAGKKDFLIKKKEDSKDDKADKNKTPKPYADRNRYALSSTISGAIFKLDLDNTHPLGFGLPDYYYSLKLNEDIYELLTGDDGWNVGTVKKNSYVSGFAGRQSKQKISNGLLLGAQTMGQGTVVYMVDDPLFRGFWENGKLLFSNAVFMVGAAN